MQCKRTTFDIWNSEEVDLEKVEGFGSFKCKDLLFANKEADQALLRLNGKADLYGHAKIKNASYYYPPSTPLTIVSENPHGTKRSRSCLTGYVLKNIVSEDVNGNPDGQRHAFSYLTSCAAIHGDSGSPVFANDGEVIGILWGGLDLGMQDESAPALFTPIHPQVARIIDLGKQSNFASKDHPATLAFMQ
jgi:hypothetical protein